MMPSQGILGFVPQEDVHALQQVWEKNVARREARFKTLTIPKEQKKHVLEALDMPLFMKVGKDVVIEDRRDCELENVASPWMLGEERAEFSIDDIFWLHSVLLEESIRALSAKGNPNEKLEILEWIFEPDYIGTVVKPTADGHSRIVHVFTNAIPWSFAFCCKLEGHDPDFWRKFLRSQMPEAVKRFYVVH
jgi:hypothetical protein